MDNPSSKICTRCKKLLELTEFGKKSGTRDGLACRCLECSREVDKLRRPKERDRRKINNQQWLEENSEYIKEYRKKYNRELTLRRQYKRAFEKMLEPEIPAQHKECACCEKILPFSEFRVIHQRGKEKLFSYCHACFKIKTKTYYKNDLESKAKRAEYERARYRLLKEKDPEGMRLKFLTIAHRRRMRHRLTGSKHTVEASVYRKVFERDGYKCLKCGTMERLELDHIVPITKGGASVLDNLQVLCRSCNASKFVKIIDYRVKA